MKTTDRKIVRVVVNVNILGNIWYLDWINKFFISWSECVAIFINLDNCRNCEKLPLAWLRIFWIKRALAKSLKQFKSSFGDKIFPEDSNFDVIDVIDVTMQLVRFQPTFNTNYTHIIPLASIQGLFQSIILSWKSYFFLFQWTKPGFFTGKDNSVKKKFSSKKARLAGT